MDGSGGISLRASSEYRKFPQISDKIIGQDDTAPAELANGNAAQLRVAIKRASLDRQHARGFGNAVGEPSSNLRHSGASLLRVARRRHSQHDDASGSENSADKAEKGQELPGANYRPREAHKMRHFLRGSAINSRTVLSSGCFLSPACLAQPFPIPIQIYALNLSLKKYNGHSNHQSLAMGPAAIDRRYARKYNPPRGTSRCSSSLPYSGTMLAGSSPLLDRRSGQRHRPCPRAAASSTTEAGLPLTIADNARDHRSSASRFSLS